MSFTVTTCPLVEARAPRADLADFTVRCPEIARAARPGQFIMVRCGDFTLRRPISICDADGDLVRFVFEVRGTGTAWLAERTVGDALDILGPQGNGFTLGDTSRPAVFVGGGIGIFPLLHACKPFGARAAVLLGFRTAGLISMVEDFQAAGADVRLATDDGTAGHHGLVTDLLRARCDAGAVDAIFACGPKPMLRATAAIAEEREIPCQLSLEQRMACGVGACLGCAQKIRRPDGTETYAHVCSDGPVFEASVVVW
ncbi:MAG TPA: dihydroorotate dehydrogenase electron transfer subunit [Armatimonadota bacterium]|nr:dihydroorotate dehydrogenase electron transfer subunit [Armatimonadota bacterium]HOS42575.1 dihydroorotate dehydrogenase electron transfer subunit [Armatimonadota bacterium]